MIIFAMVVLGIFAASTAYVAGTQRAPGKATINHKHMARWIDKQCLAGLVMDEDMKEAERLLNTYYDKFE